MMFQSFRRVQVLTKNVKFISTKNYSLQNYDTKPENISNFVKPSTGNQENLSRSTERIKESVLDPTNEDLSVITPYFSQSFNFAAYVNDSKTLQTLLDLNVNLSKIEKKYYAERILRLDLETIKKHVMFLKDYVDGELGDFLTKNPLIFFEDLDDLQVRLNYLQSKAFRANEIKRIVTCNPFWLNFSTKRIDTRLGFFQTHFTLNGDEVRYLTTKQPKVITYNIHKLKTNSFVIKEELGFEDNEVKHLLLSTPKLWMVDQKKLFHKFDYIHRDMKIPHDIILATPGILLCREFKVKQRHLFLAKLGKDQYDPTKNNYVPLRALMEGTDQEFCKTYVNCEVDVFNMFLKSL